MLHSVCLYIVYIWTYIFLHGRICYITVISSNHICLCKWKSGRCPQCQIWFFADSSGVASHLFISAEHLPCQSLSPSLEPEQFGCTPQLWVLAPAQWEETTPKQCKEGCQHTARWSWSLVAKPPERWTFEYGGNPFWIWYALEIL